MSVVVKSDFGCLKEENISLRNCNKNLKKENKFLLSTLTLFMNKPMELIMNEILESEVHLKFYLKRDIECFYKNKSLDDMYSDFEKYINESRDIAVNILFDEDEKNISLRGVYKEFVNALQERASEEEINKKVDKLVKFVRRNYNLKSLLED